MYPFIAHVAEAQLDERRRRAERYSIARAARRNRKRRRRRFQPGGFVCRVRALLAGRSPQPSMPAPPGPGRLAGPEHLLNHKPAPTP
jgi:hypothetical protein